jgi:hypothetical protein
MSAHRSRRISPIANGLSPDELALEVGIIASIQQNMYTHNMLEAVHQDEDVIKQYLAQGYRREDAVLFIFEDRFGCVIIPIGEFLMIMIASTFSRCTIATNVQD